MTREYSVRYNCVSVVFVYSAVEPVAKLLIYCGVEFQHVGLHYSHVLGGAVL